MSKLEPSLRDGGAAAREFLSWRGTGESETHRTAGGKAARIRSGIYSHVLRDEEVRPPRQTVWIQVREPDGRVSSLFTFTRPM